MDIHTLRETFRNTFSKPYVEAVARETGAFKRFRSILPLPFLLSVLEASCLGPSRAIAVAHRAFLRISGVDVGNSAYDEKLASVNTVHFFWRIFSDLLQRGNRAAYRALPAPLREFVDILVDDGSRMNVRKSLAERLRSTTQGQAALKLMAKYSMAKGEVQDIRIGAAIHHDHRLLRGAPQEGALYLRDLGFYDHSEMARIDDANAFFLLRLKGNAMPTLDEVFEGIEPPSTTGHRLDGELQYASKVDVNAWFQLADGSGRSFRVVSIEVPSTDRHGKVLGVTVRLWFVCNLPREIWSVESIASLYRLRYSVIERYFRSSKHLGRMDHLDTGRMPLLMTFLLASLLLQTLANRLTQQLIQDDGFGHVSTERVMTCLVEGWSLIAKSLSSPKPWSSTVWHETLLIMRRQGRHPNPHQPQRAAQVAALLAREFSPKKAKMAAASVKMAS